MDDTVAVPESRLAVIVTAHGLAAAVEAREPVGIGRTPLPHLLVRYGAMRRNGMLTVASGVSVRSAFYRDGGIAWAESSETTETFVDWLVANRVITVDGGVRARRLVRDGACRLGEALERTVEACPAEIGVAAERFVTSILVSAFSWRAGSFRFAPTPPHASEVEPPVRLAPLDPRNVVVEGYRRMTDLGLVSLWLGDPIVRRMLAGDPFRCCDAYTPTEREAELLHWLSMGSFSVVEAIAASPLDPPETIRLIGMLDALGVLSTI